MRLLARRPTLVALVASLALAALSFSVEPLALLPDPWAWIVWGRELASLDLDTTSGPSWKPLPVLAVAVLSVAGSAAPALWVLVARAGAMLAFVMAWRVARRLAGPVAGWVAVAAMAVTLVPSWMNIVAMGREEGLLCALVLWAVERHLARREGQAFALAFGASLLRPEAWPFLALYGLWLSWRQPRRRVPVIVLFALLLPAWFLPDVLTVGDPLQSSQKAQGGISGTTLTEPVKRAFELMPAPLQLAALAGAAIAVLDLRRTGLGAALAGRGTPGVGSPAETDPDRSGHTTRPAGPDPDRLSRQAGSATGRPYAPDPHGWSVALTPPGERALVVIALLAGALAWVALVAGTSKLANYAGIARFQHPAAAVLAVLAGVGTVWLAGAVRDMLTQTQPTLRARTVAVALVIVTLLATTIPFLPARVRRIDRVLVEESARADLDGSLGDAVDAAGGRERAIRCGGVYTNPGNEPALAWRLERHIDEVSSDKPKPPGAVFRVDAQALRETNVRRLGISLFPVGDRTFDPIAKAGVWEVLTACQPGETVADEP